MRKELTFVARYGRDAKKAFLITEVSAAQAEDWALRLFLALARNGIELPANVADAGLAGIASLGLSLVGQVKHEDAAPLMKAMMDCVQIVPDPSRPDVRRNLVEDDIEEVRTRIELRKAVIELHTGFSFADVALKSPAASATGSTASSSPSTATSRGTSAP